MAQWLWRSAATTAMLIGAMVGATNARADAEIVVAIRYLQATGASHSHLYLYREDGKLLRQLTSDSTGQDRDPIFASDGETIIFTREKSGGKQEFWSIQPRGGGLHVLTAAPAWYTATHSSPYFTNISPQPDKALPDSAPAAGDTAPRFKSPDGVVELVLRTDPKDPDSDIDGPGHGKQYLLRDLKSGQETELGKLPGFEGAYDLLHLRNATDQHFLLEGSLRLAFFGLHLDSTAGDTSYALDLTGHRMVRLSPNWAAPIPLPGEPAFLTQTEVRYVPISGTQKTANSFYMERWDSHLHKIRYSRAGAAICYGASLYRPGLKPAVVTFRDGGR